MGELGIGVCQHLPGGDIVGLRFDGAHNILRGTGIILQSVVGESNVIVKQRQGRILPLGLNEQRKRGFAMSGATQQFPILLPRGCIVGLSLDCLPNGAQRQIVLSVQMVDLGEIKLRVPFAGRNPHTVLQQFERFVLPSRFQSGDAYFQQKVWIVGRKLQSFLKGGLGLGATPRLLKEHAFRLDGLGKIRVLLEQVDHKAHGALTISALVQSERLLQLLHENRRCGMRSILREHSSSSIGKQGCYEQDYAETIHKPTSER